MQTLGSISRELSKISQKMKRLQAAWLYLYSILEQQNYTGGKPISECQGLMRRKWSRREVVLRGQHEASSGC
jgi:hypothetical protein